MCWALGSTSAAVGQSRRGQGGTGAGDDEKHASAGQRPPPQLPPWLRQLKAAAAAAAGAAATAQQPRQQPREMM